MAKRRGRHKGSRNKGYFYRTGRGWYTKVAGQFVPLTDEQGQRLRERNIDLQIVRESHARVLVQETTPVPETVTIGNDPEVGAVCATYLDHLKTEAGGIGPRPQGKAKTYIDRGQTLYDFCYGLPAEYFCGGELDQRQQRMQTKPPRRIHDGFGQRRCSQLSPVEIDTWLKAHNWSPGGRRTRVQAVKRALNFGVERKLILQSRASGH